jgi:hypothetical protein
MVFAATPVVAVLKSMWLVPRTLALKESLRGIRELVMMIGLVGLMKEMKKDIKLGGGGTYFI